MWVTKIIKELKETSNGHAIFIALIVRIDRSLTIKEGIDLKQLNIFLQTNAADFTSLLLL